MILFNLTPLEKSFVRATTYVNKAGKTVSRKAYTDNRIAKVHTASNRVRAAWRKGETHKSIMDRLQKRHHRLLDDAKEVLKHHEALGKAKESGGTHSEYGIHVDDHHHISKQIKNIHAKLEDSSQRIMLHQSHTSMKKKPVEKDIDKQKSTKKVVVQGKANKGVKSKKQEELTEEQIKDRIKKRGYTTFKDSFDLERVAERKKEVEELNKIESNLKNLPNHVKKNIKGHVSKDHLKNMKKKLGEDRFNKALEIKKEGSFKFEDVVKIPLTKIQSISGIKNKTRAEKYKRAFAVYVSKNEGKFNDYNEAIIAYLKSIGDWN